MWARMADRRGNPPATQTGAQFLFCSMTRQRTGCDLIFVLISCIYSALLAYHNTKEGGVCTNCPAADKSGTDSSYGNSYRVEPDGGKTNERRKDKRDKKKRRQRGGEKGKTRPNILPMDSEIELRASAPSDRVSWQCSGPAITRHTCNSLGFLNPRPAHSIAYGVAQVIPPGNQPKPGAPISCGPGSTKW